MNKKTSPPGWNTESWRTLPIKQQPDYKDPKKLKAVEKALSTLPALASPDEARALKRELADAAHGNAFLLQGGDCAESFAEFSDDNLRRFFRVLLQMTMALMYGASCPVVKVGRIAGQFAKPRSDNTEQKDGKELPAYRGDMVNAMEFEEEGRAPDPERLLRAYYQGAATINYLRTLARGGYASLSRINRWNMEFAARSAQGKRFEELIERINEAVGFIKACGLPIDEVEHFSEASFFTSHEALLLGYESALTRLDRTDGKYYAGSAHMLWVGDRTRAPGEAHIEYLRGIANPIGMKVGPSMTADGLLRLIDILNPDNEAGRLTLISRMGSTKVGGLLPPLIRAVQSAGKTVIWACDPMHGNTIKSPNGYKTRKFTDILSEVRQFFAIHKAEGTFAGGVHFEMTGQDVTECLGGAQAISETNLSARYHTHCDPRLNSSQALELAFLIAETLKKQKA
ncbi:MAG: 3-deoxy-7-phosphoheptulonate synthase class II [Pseudomonadota bacterium]|nr:3-deoxy-7-phosphoheptulonate synthase class II [Pseudomonadota bacterium]MDE3037647.1 3-deoxy-7-phosphoheptulonate synthase class II [Pseudomonadota bacterium]